MTNGEEEVKGPDQQASTSTDYAGMMDEARGSGTDGAVRPVPETAQDFADNGVGRYNKDWKREGMDPADPDNYGPMGGRRWSQPKAEALAQDPDLMGAEERFAKANTELKAAKAAYRAAIDGDSDTSHLQALRERRRAEDNWVDTGVDLDTKESDASKTYEQQAEEDQRNAA